MQKLIVIKNVLLFGVVFMCYTGYTQAQVSMINRGAPERAALLQIKDREPNRSMPMPGDVTAEKGGFLLSRVKIAEGGAETLTPLMSPSVTTVAGKDIQNKRHTGVIVYNVSDEQSAIPTKKVFGWNGGKWQAFVSNEDPSTIKP